MVAVEIGDIVRKNIDEQLAWLEEAFDDNQYGCAEVTTPEAAEEIVFGERIGVYIFFDKNSKEPYYVGEAGCTKTQRPFWYRINLQINTPMRNGNWGVKINRKEGWEEGKIKKFIKENVNFCYVAFDSCDDSKKFESFCNGVLKPKYND